MKFFYVVLLLSAVMCVSCKKYMQNKTKQRNQMQPLKYSVTRTQNKIQEITINLKIHTDKELISLLKKTEHLYKQGKNIRTVLRQLKREIILHTKAAETLMNYPTIGVKIKLNLISINFMKNGAKLIGDEYAPNYLRNYCSMQARLKNDTNVFYSILISGVDFRNVKVVKNGNHKGRSTGRSYSGGVCKTHKSCAIIQYRSQNLDYLIAHELAHSLGIHHDHPSFNNCLNKNTLMGTTYEKGSHPRGWSECNKRDLNRFLRTKFAACLLRK